MQDNKHRIAASLRKIASELSKRLVALGTALPYLRSLDAFKRRFLNL
jgi:hypothetical protein